MLGWFGQAALFLISIAFLLFLVLVIMVLLYKIVESPGGSCRSAMTTSKSTRNLKTRTAPRLRDGGDDAQVL